MNVGLQAIDVCAGTGIGSWAFESIGLCRTVCYIEKDAFCQQLIQERIKDGSISDAPIWDDLTTFDGKPWRGKVDFVFGGIPCQPWSFAGKRKGSKDERNLWPAFRRLVAHVRPTFALIENVPGIINGGGLQEIITDFAALGYDTEWDIISAASVGAHHLRKRVWIVAYPNESGLRERWNTIRERKSHIKGCCGNVADAKGEQIWTGFCTTKQEGQRRRRPCNGCSEKMADTESIGMEGLWPSGEQESAIQITKEIPRCDSDRSISFPSWAGGEWEQPPPAAQSCICSVAHGLPETLDVRCRYDANRVNRLKALGNAWVPQVAMEIGLRIKYAIYDETLCDAIEATEKVIEETSGDTFAWQLSLEGLKHNL